MAKVVVSPRAETDLQEIWLSIALDSPAAADRVLIEIGERMDRLAEFPEMGAPRPELAPGARILVVRSYLVLYEPTPDGVEVVRVIHGARNIDDLV